MWPRVAEVALACWLAMSPFIFRHDPAQTTLWATDFATAAAIAVFSLASFWPPLRKLHLLNLLVAGGLVLYPLLAAEHPAPAALQNELCVGLLLAMFALLPSQASLPPLSWRRGPSDE